MAFERGRPSRRDWVAIVQSCPQARGRTMPVRDVPGAFDRALTPLAAGSSSGASDAHDFVDGGDALARGANAVVEEGAHSLLHRHRPQLLGAAAPLNLETKVVVHH